MQLAPTLVVLIPALLVARAPAQVSFTLQEIGPGLYGRTFANDVSDTPAVAGASANHIVNASAAHALMWQAGTTTNLSSMGYSLAAAAAINANGVVVGYVGSHFTFEYRAARWIAGASGLLSVPTGVSRSFANDVHANGAIVGNYTPSFSQPRPCNWSPAGSFAELPLPAGAVGGDAIMIRGDGVIVGTASMAAGAQHICSWTNGVVTDLSPTTNDTLYAAALLANGDVAGSRYTTDFTPVLVSGGLVQTLPTLAGGRGACADANAAGWIVGYSTTATQQQRAVVYIGGAIFDLNTLTTGASGWTLTNATAVSEQGRICGYGLLNGETRAFLLTPQCALASYCTAGTSSNGCTPSMSASGVPSASSSSGFVVTTSGVDGQRQGVTFYGVSGAQSSPWGTGTSVLCVKSPTQRTPPANSGGSSGACDGSFTLDFTAFMAANPDALGAPLYGGELVWMQSWYRDPPTPKSTGLSSALQVSICP